MAGPVNILKILKERAKDYDCNVCGTNHSKSDIRVVGRLVDRSYVVRVTCSECQTAFKLLVVLEGTAEAAVSRVKEEKPRTRRHPPMTIDDVLDAHETLRAHTGDVNALFKRTRATRRLAPKA